MIEKTNKNRVSMSDRANIVSIGEYLKQQRLNQNKTQFQIAEAAGINRWTISQIENGEGISLNSLIPILRALDLLSVLDAFKLDTQVSPIALAKLEKQKRRRARNIENTRQNKSGSKPW